MSYLQVQLSVRQPTDFERGLVKDDPHQALKVSNRYFECSAVVNPEIKEILSTFIIDMPNHNDEPWRNFQIDRRDGVRGKLHTDMHHEVSKRQFSFTQQGAGYSLKGRIDYDADNMKCFFDMCNNTDHAFVVTTKKVPNKPNMVRESRV